MRKMGIRGPARLLASTQKVVAKLIKYFKMKHPEKQDQYDGEAINC